MVASSVDFTKKKKSKAEISKDGWTFTGEYFSDCEIWQNGKEAMLWNNDEGIVLTYWLD